MKMGQKWAKNGKTPEVMLTYQERGLSTPINKKVRISFSNNREKNYLCIGQKPSLYGEDLAAGVNWAYPSPVVFLSPLRPPGGTVKSRPSVEYLINLRERIRFWMA